MQDDLDRRTLLAAPALLAFGAGTAACAQPNATEQRASSRTLVAYFTRSGNTRVIAETLQRLLSADIFEIQPARPYPADYEQTVEQARQERDRGYEPPLAARVTDIRTYDVFLGFPIWGETAPPVIRSFLKAHDLSGKTLRPFITHGGYGAGSSQAVVQDHANGARVEAPFAMEADQERRTLNQVREWLQALGKAAGS
jgi:flavodoxin